MSKTYNLFKEQTNEALACKDYKLYNELLEQWGQNELWETEEKKQGGEEKQRKKENIKQGQHGTITQVLERVGEIEKEAKKAFERREELAYIILGRQLSGETTNIQEMEEQLLKGQIKVLERELDSLKKSQMGDINGGIYE